MRDERMSPPRAWLAFAGCLGRCGGSPTCSSRSPSDGGAAGPAWPGCGWPWRRRCCWSLAWRAGRCRRCAGRWRWLVAYAVVEISIPFPLIAAGEERVASSLAAIIIAAVPLIGAVLALRFDHSERPTPLRAARPGDRLRRGDRAGGDRRGRQRPGAARRRWRSWWRRSDTRSARCSSSTGWRASIRGPDGRQPVAGGRHPARRLPLSTPVDGSRRRGVRAVAALALCCTAAAFVILTVLIREAGPAGRR